MKKFFMGENLLKSLITKIKQNKAIQITIAILLILALSAISIISVKSLKKNQSSGKGNLVDNTIGNNNDNDNSIDKDIGTEQDGTNDKKEESFLVPAEGTRPYAVMIDNEGTLCLPQGGLHKAQIIYEIIVEGGETRFMPLFWKGNLETASKTDAEGEKTDNEQLLIGPVRSSRHYFLDYVLEHDAIYVHVGWSPRAMSEIPKFKINNINGVANGGEIFWDITKDRYNWQDTYTSSQKIDEYVKKVKYRTETDKKSIFSYNENEEDLELNEGIDASNVLIKYNQVNTSEYIYNPDTKEYGRLRKNKPHMERATEKQLTTKNIIIQFNKNYTIKGDKEGRQEVETTGSGDGWYITCGKAIKIKWTKESRNSATKYLDEKGNPIILNKGQTWVQIVPINGIVEINNQ